MKKYQLPQDSIAEKTVVALGDFDGVHKAHKKLLDKTVEIAKNKNLIITKDNRTICRKAVIYERCEVWELSFVE